MNVFKFEYVGGANVPHVIEVREVPKSRVQVVMEGVFNESSHYVYEVEIQVFKKDGVGNLHSTKGWTFIYNDTEMNYENGIDHLEDEDLRDALLEFLNDAQAGMMEFDDFVDEFGWEKEAKMAFHIYTKCQTHLREARRLFDGDAAIDLVVDKLNA